MPQLLMLDRNKVRSQFEQRFSSPQMAREYVAIYRKLCQQCAGLPIEEASAEVQPDA
jgi:cytochrome c-type biogenesis protein CcmH/NrfF